jgi:hypothetical protein
MPDAGPTRISSLGTAISAAIRRAEERDASASVDDLRRIADLAYRRVFEGNWRDGWDRLAAEVPRDADLERKAFSQEVTAFMAAYTTAHDPRGINERNPFRGLDMAALCAIKYDDSGAFTTNERRAAAIERSRQYRESSVQACLRGKAEWICTGSRALSHRETLAYYEQCPAIERALLPDGYMEVLRTRAQTSALTGSHADLVPPTMLSLLLRWMAIAGLGHQGPVSTQDGERAA